MDWSDAIVMSAFIFVLIIAVIVIIDIFIRNPLVGITFLGILGFICFLAIPVKKIGDYLENR